MSASLTDARKQELLQDYVAIKVKILDIDHKYSLSYNEVEMDMPESLGLERLQYTPLTDSQLNEMADLQAELTFSPKDEAAYQKTASQLAVLNGRMAEAEERKRKRLFQLDKKFVEGLEELTQKLVNHGLFHSSVKVSALEKANADHLADAQEISDRYEAEMAVLNGRWQSCLERNQHQIASLSQEKENYRQKVVADLRMKEEKFRIGIEKYNQTVEEKEAKYQASCARALQYARQAEYQRALTAARLYAELGETGVRRQMLSEKFACSKRELYPYTQSEAHFMVESDSFMSSQLNEYYTTLLAWIDQYLAD